MVHLIRFPGFKKRCVTFNIDDSNEEDLFIVKTLNALGLKGTFNIITDRFDEPGQMSLKDIGIYKGHETAVHGTGHISFSAFPDSGALVRELMECRSFLEKETGSFVKGAAYPYGLVRDIPQVRNALKACSFEYCRAYEYTGGFKLPEDFFNWNPTCDFYGDGIDKIIEDFNAPAAIPGYEFPKLLMVMTHGFEMRNDDLKQQFSKFCASVAAQKDVWYATAIEICEYLKAYRALKASANGKIIYNPSAIPVYFEMLKKDQIVCINPGETVEVI